MCVSKIRTFGSAAVEPAREVMQSTHARPWLSTAAISACCGVSMPPAAGQSMWSPEMLSRGLVNTADEHRQGLASTVLGIHNPSRSPTSGLKSDRQRRYTL